MKKEQSERLAQADKHFAAIDNVPTPHHPRAYGMVAKNVHDGKGSSKEFVEYAKKMLKFDSTRKPKYTDNIGESMASYGLAGAGLGGVIGGKKGALVGAGLGGLVAGPIARGLANKSEKRSVEAGKKMLSKEDLDDQLSSIYDAMNNTNKKDKG